MLNIFLILVIYNELIEVRTVFLSDTVRKEGELAFLTKMYTSKNAAS